jgi:outer membrane protein TolC
LDLINQIKKAFYQLLLAQDCYSVLTRSYRQAEANFNIVNAKFIHGTVSEFDKIRAEVQSAI